MRSTASPCRAAPTIMKAPRRSARIQARATSLAAVKKPQRLILLRKSWRRLAEPGGGGSNRGLGARQYPAGCRRKAHEVGAAGVASLSFGEIAGEGW